MIIEEETMHSSSMIIEEETMHSSSMIIEEETIHSLPMIIEKETIQIKGFYHQISAQKSIAMKSCSYIRVCLKSSK